jgi:Protein of unknown function (DUF4238)
LKHTWSLYNADWTVFENDTEVEFITSDNPAAHVDQVHAFGFGRPPPFPRFLPITPRLCLMCDLSQNTKVRRTAPDFRSAPMGTIGGGLAHHETIERINVWVAKCAEDLVLCSGESEYVRDLTFKYAKYRVENEVSSIRQPKGFVLASRTRVVERKSMASVPGGTLAV